MMMNMNKTIRFIKRLRTFQGYNRILGTNYCTDRSNNGKDDGRPEISKNNNDQSDESITEKKASPSQTHLFDLLRDEKLHIEKFRGKEDNSVDGVSDSSSSDSSSDEDVPREKQIEKVQHEEPVQDEVRLQQEDVSSLQPKSETVPPKPNEYKKMVEALDRFKQISERSKIEPKGKEKFFAPSKGTVSSLQQDSGQTFTSLFRNSAFVDLGDPVGKRVLGKIFLVVDDDLYIDFGWKFHTVCQRPKINPELYVLGAEVVLVINDLELCTIFLGDKNYTSLCEADCRLIGLRKSKSDSKMSDHDIVSEVEEEVQAEIK